MCWTGSRTGEPGSTLRDTNKQIPHYSNFTSSVRSLLFSVFVMINANCCCKTKLLLQHLGDWMKQLHIHPSIQPSNQPSIHPSLTSHHLSHPSINTICEWNSNYLSVCLRARHTALYRCPSCSTMSGSMSSRGGKGNSMPGPSYCTTPSTSKHHTSFGQRSTINVCLYHALIKL